MRLEELSLREELWIGEPSSAVRTNRLMNMIQRGKEIIRTTTVLPESEIAQMTITTSAHICAAVGYIPTAVLLILKIITDAEGPTEDTEVQAILEAADYPHTVME